MKFIIKPKLVRYVGFSASAQINIIMIRIKITKVEKNNKRKIN